MKERKIFKMNASKAIILPKKLFKQGILDENKPVYFTVQQDGKVIIWQDK